MTDWNPELYNRFRHYRAEPVEMILTQIPIRGDEPIADLGCGGGENTIELARRAARGTVRGIDLSPAMIESAQRKLADLPQPIRSRLTYEVGDIANLDDDGAYAIVFSNAALQWIPNHRQVLARWFRALRPGGRMVVQMPANDRETAKVELGKLAMEEPWHPMLAGVNESFREVPPPETYRRILGEIGFIEIDSYYHTFHHPLQSPSEVVEWYRSTGLRPFLEALPSSRHKSFLEELSRRLERAYGTRGALTFAFKRLFIWGTRPPA